MICGMRCVVTDDTVALDAAGGLFIVVQLRGSAS
jgi:hypothetical protein